MPRLPGHPKFWLGGFVTWFITLWLFSSFSNPGPDLPPIPHLDKVQHFGYFFGGAGLFSAFLYRRNPTAPRWLAIIGTTVFVVSLVGGLDEYHQSFTPGRRGNDLADWLADFTGSIAGAFVFRLVHRQLLWRQPSTTTLSPSPTTTEPNEST